MDKIKVLIVAGSMHVGGIENQLMHLLRNADKEKFQIDYTSTMKHAYYRDEIKSLGGNYIVIPDMDWKRPLHYCRKLYHVMKEGKYDIVHSHELFHSGIVLMLAKMAGVKGRFVHAHSCSDGDGKSRKRSFIRTLYNQVMREMILNCSTQMIACSSFAGEFLFGEKVTEKENYHLIYNSIDTQKYLENYSKIETGEFCEDGWKNVLHVGRVYPVKNQAFILQIAEEFRKRNQTIRCLCAGNAYDVEYFEKIQQEIKEKNLNEYIQMLGTRDDVDVLLRKSSAFILPSEYEGMPLVLIEAQAAGVASVVADHFSHEVDFNLGRVRWISNTQSAGEWADAIEDAIACGRAEKENVIQAINKKRFDSKLFADAVCELYAKCK